MAISATVQWEVRTTGLDTNGGGFRAGATGTDYSQQDAPQVSFTDLVIDGSDNTKATSAGNPFTALHVGNVVNIASGTGFTVQCAEIMSVAAGVATFDKSLGTLGSTGGVGKLGGAFLTLGKASGVMSPSNRVWLKSGDYSITGSVSIATATVIPSATLTPTSVIGYHVARGDLGVYSALNANRPRLVVNGAVVNGISISNGGGLIQNVRVEAGSQTPTNGLTVGTNGQIVNCVVNGFTTRGIILGITSIGMFNEVYGGSGTPTAAISVTNTGTVFNNHIHDNPCTGLAIAGSPAHALFNTIVNNTGATSDGIATSAAGIIFGNTIHGNGRDAIRHSATSMAQAIVLNNLLTGSVAGYGLIHTVAGHPARAYWDGNAFHDNALGNRSGFDDEGTTNPVYASGAYTNVRDVTLTGSPYVDAATDDYSLNSTSGAGSAAKGSGVPAIVPNLAVENFIDFGAIQAEATGGGGGGFTLEELLEALLTDPGSPIDNTGGKLLLQDGAITPETFSEDIETGPIGGDSAGVTELLTRVPDDLPTTLTEITDDLTDVVGNTLDIPTMSDALVLVKAKTDTIVPLGVNGIVTSATTTTVTPAVGELSLTSGAYDDAFIVFHEAPLKGQTRVVETWNGTVLTLQADDPLPIAPAADATFTILGKVGVPSE